MELVIIIVSLLHTHSRSTAKKSSTNAIQDKWHKTIHSNCTHLKHLLKKIRLNAVKSSIISSCFASIIQSWHWPGKHRQTARWRELRGVWEAQWKSSLWIDAKRWTWTFSTETWTTKMMFQADYIQHIDIHIQYKNTSFNKKACKQHNHAAG